MVGLAIFTDYLVNDFRSKFATWDAERDRRFLNPVLSELEKPSGTDFAAHNEAIQALLRFNRLLVNGPVALQENNAKSTFFTSMEFDLD